MDSAAAQRWMPRRRLIIKAIAEEEEIGDMESVPLVEDEVAFEEYNLIKPASSSAPKPRDRPERYTCSATEESGVGNFLRRAIDVTMPCKTTIQGLACGKHGSQKMYA